MPVSCAEGWRGWIVVEVGLEEDDDDESKDDEDVDVAKFSSSTGASRPGKVGPFLPFGFSTVEVAAFCCTVPLVCFFGAELDILDRLNWTEKLRQSKTYKKKSIPPPLFFGPKKKIGGGIFYVENII